MKRKSKWLTGGKLPKYDDGGQLASSKNSAKDAATAAVSAIPVYGQILAPIMKIQDKLLGNIGEKADGTLKKGVGASLANVSNPLGGFSDLATGDFNSFLKRSTFGLIGGKTKAEAAAEEFRKKQHQDQIAAGTNNYTNAINAGFQPNGNPNAIMKDGGSIHIKSENRGKFNALKKRTGKSTEELTHSSNPLTKKRAIFAQNAKKWKHEDGGEIMSGGGTIKTTTETKPKDPRLAGKYNSSYHTSIKNTPEETEKPLTIIKGEDTYERPAVLDRKDYIAKKKYGGDTYEAEGGEVVIGNKPKVLNGGKLLTLKDGVYKVLGNKHEQGGVDMKGGKFVLSNNEELAENGKTPADKVIANPSKQNINDVAEKQEMKKGKYLSRDIMAFGGRIKLPFDESLLDSNQQAIRSTNNSLVPSNEDVTGYIQNQRNNVSPLATTGTSAIPIENNLSDRIPSSTKGGSKFGRLTGKVGGILGNMDLTSFGDNITNAILNTRRAGRTVPEESTTPNARAHFVDNSASIQGVKDKIYALQKGLDTTNAGQSNANKIAATATGISQINQINQDTNNINAQVGNDFAVRNQGNEARNNQIQFGNKMRRFQAANDIDAETSANVANLTGDLQAGKRDKSLEALSHNQNLVDLASTDPRGIEYLKKQLGQDKFDELVNGKKRNTRGLFGARRSKDAGVIQ